MKRGMIFLGEIRWEMPEIKTNSTIEIKLNDQSVLCADAKQFIDYLTESIVAKNNKAIMKRNVYMQTLAVVYRLGLVFIIVKFFPEIIALFINMRG
jgi:hypothetical protein